MFTKSFALPLALMISCGVGCSSARYVSQTPEGGVVAIPQNTPRAREEALAMIAERCPEGYEIVSEKEVITGQRTVKRTVTKPVESESESGLDLGTVIKVVSKVAGPALAGGNGGGSGVQFSMGGVEQPKPMQTEETFETIDQKEWQITYRRKSAPAGEVDFAAQPEPVAY